MKDLWLSEPVPFSYAPWRVEDGWQQWKTWKNSGPPQWYNSEITLIWSTLHDAA